MYAEQFTMSESYHTIKNSIRPLRTSDNLSIEIKNK